MRRLPIAFLATIITASGLLATPAAAAGPANDGYLAAETLAGSGSVVRSNRGATVSANEPSPDCCSPEATIWFSWTAPESGRVTFDTWGSEIDTVLAVWTGATQTSAIEVVSDDDGMSCDTTSFVQFDAVRGTRYRIQVGSWSSDETSSALRLTWNWHRSAKPLNDDLGGAATVVPAMTSRTITASTEGATAQPDAFAPETIGESTTWYRIDAPAAGVLSMRTVVPSRPNVYGETPDVTAELWSGNPDAALITWQGDGDTEDIDIPAPGPYFLRMYSPEICRGGRYTVSYQFQSPARATTRYTADQYALVSAAAQRLGLTVPEYQHDALLAWQFIYGLGRVAPQAISAPTPGRIAVTSDWAPAEQPNHTAMTSGWNLPLPAAQQVAALGLAFLFSMAH